MFSNTCELVGVVFSWMRPLRGNKGPGLPTLPIASLRQVSRKQFPIGRVFAVPFLWYLHALCGGLCHRDLRAFSWSLSLGAYASLDMLWLRGGARAVEGSGGIWRGVEGLGNLGRETCATDGSCADKREALDRQKAMDLEYGRMSGVAVKCRWSANGTRLL